MKLRILGTLLVGLLTAMTAYGETRFAYVDMQRALGEIEEGKAAKAKLKKQFESKQKELDQKQEELKQDNANLEKLAREGVLKEDRLREKKIELEKKLMDVTKYWQDSQKALSEEERKLTQNIFSKMAGVIRSIAEADGISLVFDKNEGGLLYAPDSLDITNELVRKYNSKFGADSRSSGKSSKSKSSAKTN
jgi:outer membrane protein